METCKKLCFSLIQFCGKLSGKHSQSKQTIVNNNTAGKIGDFDSVNNDMCEIWNECENQSMGRYVFCGLKGRNPSTWVLDLRKSFQSSQILRCVWGGREIAPICQSQYREKNNVFTPCSAWLCGKWEKKYHVP